MRCFPRFHRRGLIEGKDAESLSARRQRVFRGFTAAASLKVVIAALDHPHAVRVFRGFTAAASLKVQHVLVRLLLVGGQVFRGFTAAASLKDKDFRVNIRRLEVFRGFTAAASLKGF